jgi:hypothetical protein
MAFSRFSLAFFQPKTLRFRVADPSDQWNNFSKNYQYKRKSLFS